MLNTHCFWAISLDSANLLSKKRSMACCPSIRPCSKDISSSRESVFSFLDFDLLSLNVLCDFLLGLLLFIVTASSSPKASRASSNTCKVNLNVRSYLQWEDIETCFTIKLKQELRNGISSYLDGPNINLTDRHRDADARSGVKKTDPCLQPRRQDHGKEEAGVELRASYEWNSYAALVCTDAPKPEPGPCVHTKYSRSAHV